MPVGNGKKALKTTGRPLKEMAHLKKSIVQLRAETNCLAHAMVIAISRLENDKNYKSYRQGRKILPKVDNLLKATGVDLSEGGGLPELEMFQLYFRDRYKIVVYTGLNCDSIMYEGRVDAPKRINLLYDADEKYFHIITRLTGALVKQFVCEACGKGCRSDITHKCDQICSDCHQSPPCIAEDTRVPCNDCNRHFRSQKCFENHKTRPQSVKKAEKKSICEKIQLCAICNELNVCDWTVPKHECFKRYCADCRCNRETGHLC
jgi:hypothetical protein